VVARAVHGRAAAGPPSTARDLADVAELLPPRRADAVTFSAALMELGAIVCTARKPACGQCPLPRCAWDRAGRPAADTIRRAQRYEGTDRQARGRLLDVLRGASGPVGRARLDAAWPQDPGQRVRALDSLLVDGLVEQTADGRFALAGEAGDQAPAR
jgi:A/G-specific adenine glycosylase